jgi:hypothetical protein
VREVAAGGTLTLMPAVGNGIGNYAVIEVFRTNDSRFGRFLTRGSSAVIELEDPAAMYETTDTGVETAIYYDSVSGNIVLKNKTTVSRSFVISIRGMGAV